MPMTGYDDEAEKIGLVPPASSYWKRWALVAFAVGIGGGALLADLAK